MALKIGEVSSGTIMGSPCLEIIVRGDGVYYDQ